MGKNISGTGMDTNIIGRMYQYGSPEPETPKVHIISVYGLTVRTVIQENQANNNNTYPSFMYVAWLDIVIGGDAWECVRDGLSGLHD